MSVEASNLNNFPSHLIQDRDSVMPCVVQSGPAGCVYNAPPPMGYPGIPFAATLPTNKSFYQQPVCEAKTSMNADSGLTYNISATRKRSRDPINQFYINSTAPRFPVAMKNDCASQFPSVFVDDTLPQFQQYQMEIDTIISQHTKRIKLELEERQNKQARLFVAAIGEGVTKKLKEKEDQIQKISKLNFFLQERVKSLYVENQLWREMAQTNEATANSLRSDLEQVLSHVGGGGEERLSAGACAVEDDVESCCGSSDNQQKDYAEEETVSQSRNCKRCGERESCVLLLPCRHLCLCNVCGSGSNQLRACPVCKDAMNATLHVNMSSS